MMLRLIRSQVALIAFALAVMLVVQYGPPSIVRLFMVTLFVVYCPGIAFVGLLNLKDTVATTVIAVALSLALGVIVSQAIVLTNQWDSDVALVILVGLTIVGALLQIFFRLQREILQRIEP